jgi:putative toxin-antitoxin system antitoxin component (TIGR02293 family)
MERSGFMASDVAIISSVLGGGKSKSGSLFDIAQSVERGLSVMALDRVVAFIAPDDGAFIANIVPKATLSRRRASESGRLSIEEGNKVARLAKVWAMAMRVWDDQASAQEFLRRPHPMLDGRAPRDVAVASDPGADAVINVMGRGAYGGGV